MKTLSVRPRNAIRYTATFHIDLPASKIDLYKWVTEMSPIDYATYSSAHQAMGTHRCGDRFFMFNVENIGNETIVQRYELMEHSPGHVKFYSSGSTAFIMRWIPVVVGVPWELTIVPKSENSCQLDCMIGADFPNLLVKIGAWFNGLGGYFLRKHLNQEGIAFANDITAKFR